MPKNVLSQIGLSVVVFGYGNWILFPKGDQKLNNFGLWNIRWVL